eukprot:CAMPEP_0180123162 /NCGR_PEP_ID=MMETSP0986-20121125/3975_1 /TAXON_ID=697907 /ORGANISM="non described non described, Strain CCMP2293" /LENGTH=58 /DNA_ID=CAMNT_0022062425 /DNA_START=384 /DNA_END=560 /DNA_ORIENTATION=+
MPSDEAHALRERKDRRYLGDVGRVDGVEAEAHREEQETRARLEFPAGGGEVDGVVSVV